MKIFKKLQQQTVVFPVYFDVVELHPTAVRRSQGGGEVDLFGQLTPLPAVRFGALNLTQKHQRLAPRFKRSARTERKRRSSYPVRQQLVGHEGLQARLALPVARPHLLPGSERLVAVFVTEHRKATLR